MNQVPSGQDAVIGVEIVNSCKKGVFHFRHIIAFGAILDMLVVDDWIFIATMG